MTESEVDLNRTYDAIVVGSGAAGGMAAHVLTTHGLKVLMLEAGKKLPIEQELRSMEWPYDNAHRGKLPPDHHALTFNEYTIRKPPYGPGFEKSKHLHSYVGHNDYVKNIVVDERENPYTGTNFAWVRARCLGGKTNIWGRLSLRFSEYEFKAKSRDGYGENWPVSYFTRPEYMLIEELSETIIPADSHSGGAKAAKVADYVEQVLHESVDDNRRSDWRQGLRLIDLMSHTTTANHSSIQAPKEESRFSLYSLTTTT